MNELDFSNALESIWKLIRRCNKYIDETTPWLLIKDESKKDELDTVLYNLCESIRIAAVLISPIMNETANKIFGHLGITDDKDLLTFDSTKEFGLLKEGTIIEKGQNLFNRLDIEKEIEFLEELFAPKEEDNGEYKEEIVHKEQVTIDDFAKLEFRVGKVLEGKKHPKADKLLVFKIKVGNEERQIVSGISKFYDPKELEGKKVIVVCNLKPVKLRGELSEGMILAAFRSDDSKLELPFVTDIEDGCTVG